jgi:hypothetical protein
VPTWAWVLLIVGAVVLLVLVVVALVGRQRRRRRLEQRFGPEYGRTVERAGGRRAAEADLEQREEKRQRLQIVPLSPQARQRYLSEWRELQARFVDEPSQSLLGADRLLSDAMRERGYPTDDFDQRAADVSVDHPDFVENYRAAQAIYLADQQGEATTEQLRQALIHYRTLFAELLETDEQADKEEVRGERDGAGSGTADGRQP